MKRLIRMGWVLASALVLCFSSCLNEASDPNSGAEDLPGNVAPLTEQVVAMKSSVNEMESLQATLAEIAEYEAFAAELEACATSVKEHIASVEAGLSGSYAVLTAMSLQNEIAGVTGALKAQVALTEGVETLKATILSLEKGVAAWFGKDFKSYFEVSSEHAMLQSLVAVVESHSQFADAMASDVEVGLRVGDASELQEVAVAVKGYSVTLSKLNAEMTALRDEVKQGYTSAINSPSSDANSTIKTLNTKAAAAVAETETTLADLASRISACEAALADIDARLEKVEADVAELLEMIQSLTFVSDFSEENAYAYYNMDVNTKVSDSNLPYYGKAQRTATGNMELTYMVRPAAAAKALNANLDAVDVIGYYAKSIATKAPQAADYITLNVTKVAVVNETRGMVTVTVTPNFREAFYYKEIGAKCALNVKSGKTDIVSNFVEILPKDNSTTVYATGVTPNRTSIELDKGESIDLSAVVYPSNAVQVCYWTSTNNTIASFNGSTMTANEVGNTTVKVTTSAVDEWGLPLVAEIPVKVNEAIRLTGQRYVEVGYTAEMFLEYPRTAIIESKVWSSSDPSKLTVDQNGKVTGVADTYNTTTKSYGDITVSCTINGVTTVSWNMFVAAVQPREIVTPALSNSQSEISMRVDESLSLASTISPTNVPEGAYKIIYQCGNYDRFINFDTGVINEAKNVLNQGVAYVDITIKDRDQSQDRYMVVGEIKKTITVKILPYYVNTIYFDPVEMQLGQTVKLSPKLTADVDGKTPTNTKLTWKSSNETVATVDDSGVVTSKTSGTVTITATATDGSNVSGTCTVTITQPWKEFNIGDYVVRTSNGDIDFSADYNTAKGKGTVVGVVIAKTNPRATDNKLPSECTHGIAVGLKHEAPGAKLFSSAPASSEPYNMYKYYLAYSDQGYASPVGIKYSGGYVRNDNGKLPYGYNNTLLFKAFLNYHTSISSDMKSRLSNYNTNNLRPSNTSEWYLPSIYEMWMVYEAYRDYSLNTKLSAAGGDQLQNPDYYLTVSEVEGTENSNIAAIRAMVGDIQSRMKTSTSMYARYFFAF